MIIRKAKIKDIKQCLNIQKLDNGKYWKAIDFKKSVQNKGVVFLVAEENKEILGYITGFIVPTKRTDALLHETRVDKRQRKKGIGKKLVNAFCKEIFKKDS
ncbi:MAG: GNAT family N-acetyltransferase, partial [Nanoarchaeota archaeon]|nr:GNAT family N-acetyltransferase [Nanoarchaeota archaeon]